MQRIIVFLVLLQSCSTISQSLHPLEDASNHYAELKQLSASKNAARASLDGISYSPNRYGSTALLYTIARPVYLNGDQVDELKNSVTFPANSSDQTRAELDFLLQWQEKRTAAQETRAARVLAPVGYWPHIAIMKDHERYQENMEDLFFEGRTVMGESCSAQNYPATAKLLQGVTQDMRIMEFTVKYHLLRPRPYDLEPKLRPLQRMSSPSFASGHTLWAYIQAFTWSELIPSKRDSFLELAYEIGESREIMGIHYPSDEEAARILAHRMLTAMWSNPGFMSDLKQAKLEWKD